MTRIAITLGDPNGIGPEIVAAALAGAPALRPRIVVYGDRGVLARAGAPADTAVVEVTRLSAADSEPGRPSLAGAAAQVAYLEAALADAAAGRLDALVTAPISKTQARRAGFAFPGHTELLAARLGAPGHPVEHAMAFFGPRLRVVLATIHLRLGDVPAALTAEGVARAVFLGGQALARSLAIPAPRIGVLGLNPHAGEGGLFGREELDVIRPGMDAGLARLHAAGIPATVRGPLVPDAAYREDCDLFVAMYHDQALIPVKLLDFDLAVNVTLGLPIVRTSPDHGVAYDIAGKGVARPQSFAAALDLAARLVGAGKVS